MSNDQTPTPRTDTKTLALAMRVLSHHIRSEDGVTNAALAEAADRLDEQADHIRRLEEAGDVLFATANRADDDIREHVQVANYNLHGLINTGDRIDPPNPPATIHQAGIDASVLVRLRINESCKLWLKAKEAKR